MIYSLFAALASACASGQSAFTKLAPSNGKLSYTMYFNTLKIGVSFVFFLLISCYNLQFHLHTVLFASGYGFTLFFSTLFGYMALISGFMALTSLIVSYSVQ